jgi:hypothetical protein
LAASNVAQHVSTQFDLKAEQSLGAAFRKHIEEVHRSSEKFDDVKLTAPGVVKRKTK